MVKKILNDLRVSKALKGYYLWIDIINNVNKDYDYNELAYINITEYYEQLSKRHKIPFATVERNLRTCIFDKKEKIAEYFNYYDRKITNKVFLILAVEKIKENNKGGWNKFWKKI